MFNLTDHHLYKWHRLFLLLSLERISLFLPQIEFPLTQHLPVLRPMARVFIRQFYIIEPQLLVEGQVSQAGRDLFDKTYQELAAKIGQPDAQVFCQWGNNLLVDSPVETELLTLWEDLFIHLTDKEKESRLHLPDVLRAKSFVIKAVTAWLKVDLRGLYDALDILESAPKNPWDLAAYRVYNQGDRRDMTEVPLNLSPLEYFEQVIYYVKIRTAFNQIRSVLDEPEYAALLEWISAQPALELDMEPADIFAACAPH